MTGLSLKGRATRDRIVTGAAEVMRGLGVGVATLDDVRARTSTSKSQLFHYFPGGREELLLAVAEHEAARVIADQQPHLGRLCTWEDFSAWRDVVVLRYREQGPTCPLQALTSQLGPSSPGARAVVRELLRDQEEPLRAGIESMQASGRLADDIDASAAARALVVAIQGGVQIMLATGSAVHLEDALDLALDRLRPADAPTRLRA